MNTQHSTPVSISILVVDDDQMVREVTAGMLSDAGHTVHESADGVEALAYLAGDSGIDLVITDINMPHMDGAELLAQIKHRWPGMPVLLVSGRPQPPGGSQPFMAKPFGWNALIDAVALVCPPTRIHPT